jgi:acyl-CoA synthetase (NDP forming)
MINDALLDPRSIVVVGASNDVHKLGGKVLRNLIDHGFEGALYAANPNQDEVQGVSSCRDLRDLPHTDLAILAVAAARCPAAVDLLAREKGTRAFIVLSAGFSEKDEEGARLERQIVEAVHSVNGCLIGPNCTGILTPRHASMFTLPIPELTPGGCDFVSGSGATAAFIMESAILKGIKFANVFSVGNSAQTGVEDVLAHMDETFDPETSSRIKLLYLETIKDPDSLLEHASSLIRKGCKIAAIKAGASEAGSRAASSHTGAIASHDLAVEALFRKAGIVRCFGREELTTVAGVFMYKPLHGKRIAIITHAGGPAVMLTDALSAGGLEIPRIEGPAAQELLASLLPGSSVANPIDFLATGTAEHLGRIIDACNDRFDQIDGMVVIFGTPGLSEIFDVYKVLHRKMTTSPKPIFPVLPSVITARREVEYFLGEGHVSFPDEVLLGRALTRIHHTPSPAEEKIDLHGVDVPRIRSIIDRCERGYVSAKTIQSLLSAAHIPLVGEGEGTTREEILALAAGMGYPVVAKVVGPLHKSDVGGVTLNIKSEEHLVAELERMMRIPGATAVMVQPMLSGLELFIGATYEPRFGHVMLVGLGGIFVEVLEDVASGLAPLTYAEAHSMIRSLRSYRIIRGARGKEGVDERKLAEILVRLSTLLRFATEIKELDLNPLLGTPSSVTAVDARIRVGD